MHILPHNRPICLMTNEDDGSRWTNRKAMLVDFKNITYTVVDQVMMLVFWAAELLCGGQILRLNIPPRIPLVFTEAALPANAFWKLLLVALVTSGHVRK